MPHHLRRLVAGTAVLAALAAGGAAIGNAATSHSSTTTTSLASSALTAQSFPAVFTGDGYEVSRQLVQTATGVAGRRVRSLRPRSVRAPPRAS